MLPPQSVNQLTCLTFFSPRELGSHSKHLLADLARAGIPQDSNRPLHVTVPCLFTQFLTTARRAHRVGQRLKGTVLMPPLLLHMSV